VNPLGLNFDTNFLIETLDPTRWPPKMDSILVVYLLSIADVDNVLIWDVSANRLCDGFRDLQVRFVLFFNLGYSLGQD
jgi:hypothetical protein